MGKHFRKIHKEKVLKIEKAMNSKDLLFFFTRNEKNDKFVLYITFYFWEYVVIDI